jgi:hypothetical protein
MARMFPPHGPRPPRSSEPVNEAEWRIFEALRLRLGVDADGDDTGEYIVFPGVKWFAPLPNGALQPAREMDFLIVSRHHGLLVVETKSAKIALSTGRGVVGLGGAANLNAVGDAFEQAEKLEQELTHVLLSAPHTCKHMASYQIGAAVWFPFSQHPWPRDEQMTRKTPNRLILDSVDLTEPESGVLRAFEYLNLRAETPPLSDEAIEALIQTLYQDTPIMQSRLIVRMPAAEKRIQALTQEQYNVLEALNDLPRLEVRGAAGTGKTVLAYEKAFRLAREGKRVLYLCSNPALSAWLTQMRDREDAPENEYFSIYNLQEFCALAPARRTPPPARQDDEGPDTQRAAQALNDLTRSWRGRQDRLFDAILVDDGQDFDTPLWKPLLQLLKDPRAGLFYVFYDPAQRERDGKWSVDVPGKVVMHPLVINVRNTQEIFDLIKNVYPERDRKPLLCHGEHGAPPLYVDPHRIATPTGGDPEEAALSHALDYLIRTEGLRPEDVLIITCRPRWPGRYEQSRLFRGKGDLELSGHVIAQSPDITTGKVALTTIRLARGLERPAVILCELDGLRSTRSDKHREKILYSLISRAKHLIAIIGSESDLLGQEAAIKAVSG